MSYSQKVQFLRNEKFYINWNALFIQRISSSNKYVRPIVYLPNDPSSNMLHSTRQYTLYVKIL